MKPRKYTNSYCFDNNVILEYREDGEKKQEIIEDFQWYLIVWKKDFDKKILHKIPAMLKAGVITKYLIDGEYVKLYSKNLNNRFRTDSKDILIKWLKDNDIEMLEADVSSNKRYCLDHDIELANEYEILYFDIETDDTQPSIVIGAEQILSIAAIDNHGKKYYFTDDNEQFLLQGVLKLFEKYDIIVGWNSGGFDLPYIQSRMRRYNLKFDWYKIAHIDLMKRFIYIFRSDSKIQKFSLENISYFPS